jgi:hypothetical protein
MQTLRLTVIGILLATPSLARTPSAQEAKQCVMTMDSDLVSGYEQQEKADHSIRNIVRLCSEYYNLRHVDVLDVSRAENVADVKVRLQYTVIKAVTSKSLKRCIGIDDPGESHVIPASTEIPPSDRKISMQLWTSGWKCKGD